MIKKLKQDYNDITDQFYNLHFEILVIDDFLKKT